MSDEVQLKDLEPNKRYKFIDSRDHGEKSSSFMQTSLKEISSILSDRASHKRDNF
jgi:hypothetical protein